MPAISDLLLEQYALGELTPEMEEKVRQELDRDPQLQARYEAIKSSDREILERYPPAAMARAIDEKLHGPREAENQGMASSMQPAGRWALQLALGLPAAALVLIFLSFFILRDRNTSDIRVKGLAPHLNAFLKTSQGARELASGSLVGRGDLIQLSYTAGEARYGVILWVDGRGAITWLLPPGYNGAPGTAPVLDRQSQVVLPNAYELDDAPGFERFILVYADKPFDIVVAAEAARSLSRKAGSSENMALSLPAGIKQYSLLLKKRGLAP
jgi:hypothetical protein